MTVDDLFAIEQEILLEAEQSLESGLFRQPRERETFQMLLLNYRKLLRESKRLLRIGDRQERRLMDISSELRLALEENERLRKLALDSNPLTELPGNNMIAHAVQEILDSQERDTVKKFV